MKNIGKIGIAAGLAAAAFILLKRRKDGTRLLDDVTHQVTNWANMLMNFKSNLNDSKGSVNGQSMHRPADSGSSQSRRTANQQE